MARPPRPLLEDRAGVSPVVGTVLVLAITVLGIASILYWGAPTIDRIQSGNAQVAIEGEFEGLRDATQELSVPDHSRFPTVAVPSGNLVLQQGSRFMVTVDYDGSATNCGGASCQNCDFHVTNWADGSANAASVTIAPTHCRTVEPACPPVTAGNACLEIYSVGATTLVKQAVTGYGGGAGTATVAGADFSKGDWMFQLTDGSTSATPTVFAQAWLHSSDQVAWTLTSSTGSWQEYLDGGAIFSNKGGTYFLDKAPVIGDTSFGPAYYGLWLRTLSATSYGQISGQGSHQVFFSLAANSVRADLTQAYRLRFDVAGNLAQPWCNALKARNPTLTSGSLFVAAYTDDTTSTPSYSCATGQSSGDSLGVRSVCYIQFAAQSPALNACTATGTAFRFRFLNAHINSSLSI